MTLQGSTETIEATLLAVADPAPAFDYSPPEPGNRYVAVQVRAVNTGTVPYQDGVYMELVDSSGVSYETNFSSVQLSGTFPFTRLIPGDVRVGWVCSNCPKRPAGRLVHVAARRNEW